ncbi:uncharacterized protein CC84DRAFT_435243 [Paraphaeosphaeria sporulosa]|uniref:Uncharacterized protein n=1 Tax=Paraphaeosphaeria sporulosa TaxID=1460663 RepID=A0A177CQY3_9PLEO|nr:uncharacterized protein CC84DRAFT_435243 [Paraphaeosphaeria sporulosa]OAG09368.1 hypothetical protein CC84DRAFT_435243 [Paraphaeosphaeria sporulosa]
MSRIDRRRPDARLKQDETASDALPNRHHRRTNCATTRAPGPRFRSPPCGCNSCHAEHPWWLWQLHKVVTTVGWLHSLCPFRQSRTA